MNYHDRHSGSIFAVNSDISWLDDIQFQVPRPRPPHTFSIKARCFMAACAVAVIGGVLAAVAGK